MKRVHLLVPVLVLGLTAIAAAAPSVTSADNPIPVTIHEGGDPTAWGYTPTTTTVSVGQTVTWTNSGAFAHDAAATDGSWKTQLLDPGASGSVTFNTPGTYTYICTPHPWMQATITVTAAAPPPAPTAAPNDPSTTQPANTPTANTDSTTGQSDSGPAQDPTADSGS